MQPGPTASRAFRSKELKIINFGHPSDDWPTLLNFRDRTAKRIDLRAIELLRTCIHENIPKLYKLLEMKFEIC
jgi:hypothetical protein